ncbi:MAG: rhomboid family intramembrane serine protease [Bacteroidota bacterium]
MASSMQFKYSPKVIIYPVLMVLVLWLVFWFQVRVDSGIKSYGIRPNDNFGFLGAFTSPFLHGDISHLYNNTIPIFVLSMALFFFYPKIAWKVIVLGIVISGLLTWIIADRGNHIGASGLIYVLFGFIFFKGIFAKHYRLIALSFLVVFLYGSMVWYIFPIKQGMSWQGHLSGLITGFVFAIIFRKQIAKPEKYIWEQSDYSEEDDPFMKHFDEDGNFIEQIDENVSEEDTDSNTTINYIYKDSKD